MGIKWVIVTFLICFTLIQAKSLHLRREPFELSHQYSSSRSVGGGGIAGFIIGPLLFVWSFILIWNNERKAAIDHRRMTLASKIVRQVNPFNPEQVRSAHGQLVHIAGDSQCSEQVTDPESGISMSGVVKIKRHVQVKEIRGSGSDRNRTYAPMWVSSHDSTPGGGYTNDPGAWFIKDAQVKSKNVYVGNYQLSESLIDKLDCENIYTPQMQHAYNIASRSGGRVRSQPVIQGQYTYFPSSPGSIDAPGTLRVKYTYCNTGSTSIISQSDKNTFVPYRIDVKENGKPDTYSESSTCCCCVLCDCTSQLLAPITQINLISQQKQSYQEMIQKEQKNISLKKNLIRFGAYFLMVISICAFFSPITTLLGYVPLLGGVLSNVVGLAIFIAALIVCIPLFLLAVAACWLVFHPKVGLIILGVALLITGIVLAIIFVNKGKNNGQSPQQAAQTVKHLASSLRSFID